MQKCVYFNIYAFMCVVCIKSLRLETCCKVHNVYAEKKKNILTPQAVERDNEERNDPVPDNVSRHKGYTVLVGASPPEHHRIR